MIIDAIYQTYLRLRVEIMFSTVDWFMSIDTRISNLSNINF